MTTSPSSPSPTGSTSRPDPPEPLSRLRAPFGGGSRGHDRRRATPAGGAAAPRGAGWPTSAAASVGAGAPASAWSGAVVRPSGGGSAASPTLMAPPTPASRGSPSCTRSTSPGMPRSPSRSPAPSSRCPPTRRAAGSPCSWCSPWRRSCCWRRSSARCSTGSGTGGAGRSARRWRPGRSWPGCSPRRSSRTARGSSPPRWAASSRVARTPWPARRPCRACCPATSAWSPRTPASTSPA